MSYKIGYVYHVESFDQAKPKKGKFGVCVCASKGYFFAINTENRQMYDCIPILANQHPELGQDRFVGCKNILTLNNNAKIQEKYKISNEFLTLLIEKIKSSKFLAEVNKQIILSELQSLIPKI